MVAASVHNGTWVSVNAGVSWDQISTLAGFGSAMSADGSKMVISTCAHDGLGGGTVYISEDSGGTWSKATVGSGIPCWRSVSVSADAQKIAIVGTTQSTIDPTAYLSNDGGATWSPTEGGGYAVSMSSDGNMIAQAADSSIRLSSDGGQTWTSNLITGVSSWRSLGMSGDGNSIVVGSTALSGDGSSGGLYVTTDFGTNWAKQSSLGERNWQGAAAISGDGSSMFVGAYMQSIFSSINNGTSWTELTVEGQLSQMGVKILDEEGKSVIVNTRDSIYSTSDGGDIWSGRSAKGGKIMSTSADGNVIMVSTENSETSFMSFSVDGGGTWTNYEGFSPMNIAVSGDGSKMFVTNFPLPGSMEYAYLAVSTDGGLTWNKSGRVRVMTNDSTLVANYDGTKLAAVDVNGAFLYSSDSGATWDGQSMDFISIDMNRDGTNLAGITADGVVHISSDSGNTWNRSLDSEGKSFRRVAISSDGNTLAAISQSDVYTSLNSGLTWVKQSSIPSPSTWGMWTGVDISGDGTTIAVTGDMTRMYMAHISPMGVDMYNLSDTDSAGVSGTISDGQIRTISYTCYSLNTDSIKVLNPSTITPPEDGVKVIGGVEFNINCATIGGRSDFTVRLGSYFADTSVLRAYKKHHDGTVLDITAQVNFGEAVVDTKTVTTIDYSLVDGGQFDEDGVANGVIVDPLYIGALGYNDENGPDTPSVESGDELAATGVNVSVISLLGLAGLAGGMCLWRKLLSS